MGAMSDRLANQPDRRPTRKLAAGGAGGLGVVVLTWVARKAGVELDPEVAGAMVLFVSGVVGYLTRDRRPRGDTPGTNGIADHGLGAR